MTKQKKVLILLFFLFFLPCSYSFAEELSSNLKESLIKEAALSQENGDFPKAIRDFARILLLEKNNEAAQNSLKQLAKQENLNVEDKLQLTLWEDYAHTMAQLHSKIEQLKERNSFLAEELISLGINKSSLETDIGDLVKEYKPLTFHDSLIEQETIFSAKDPLMVLNNLLAKENENLSQQFVYLKKINSYLVSQKKSAILDGGAVSYALGSDGLKGIKKVSSKNIYAQLNEEQLNSLKGEMDSMYNELQGIKEGLLKKNEKIDELTRQVVDFSLELSEKDKYIYSKEEGMERLSREIDDLQARFALSQKILEEKEVKIQSLEESVNKLKVAVNESSQYYQKILKAKDQELSELGGFLEIYKAKLSDVYKTLKEKEAQMHSLKEKISAFAPRNVLGADRVLSPQEPLVDVHAELQKIDTFLKNRLQYLENTDPFLYPIK